MRVPEELQTQEELLALVTEIRSGSTKAKAEAWQELMYRMRPLVVSILRRKGHGLGQSHGKYNREDLDDMTTTAWEGVWETVQDYDPDHEVGKTFWQVCYWRVNNSVNTYLANNSGHLPLTYWAWQKARGIDNVLDDEERVWSDMTEEELAELTGVKSAKAILEARREAYQLDEDADLNYSPSAEEEMISNMEYADLNETLDSMIDALQRGNTDKAESLAWDYVDRQDTITGESEEGVVDQLLDTAHDALALKREEEL